MKGSEFAESVRGLSVVSAEYNAAVREQIDAGNVVDWGSTIIELEGGLVIEVTNDVLAIGTADDCFRVPVNGETAQYAADAFNCILPSSLISDAVWGAAEQKIDPQTIVQVAVAARMGITGKNAILAAMTTSEFCYEASRLVDEKKSTTGLVAGHRKDIALSNRMTDPSVLAAQGGPPICIYGLHTLSGVPIQQCETPDRACTPHAVSYADYSHGVRLVSMAASYQGEATDMVSAYLAGQASYAGPLYVYAYGEGGSVPPGNGSGGGGAGGPAPRPKARRVRS